MMTYRMQYPHFGYTHLSDVLSFYGSVFYIIHHHMSNHRHVELTFSLHCHKEYQIFIVISLIMLLFYY
jgi:hypothetical protein